MYSIGEYVVKAGNGVCEIRDIVKMSVPGEVVRKDFYLLIPYYDRSTKIYVSVDGHKNVIRPVMTEKAAWDLIEQLPQIEETWIENEKLREQKYKEAIRSCDPNELVGIIKNMYYRKQQRMAEGRKNTAVDERYFKMAEEILHSEIAFSIKKSRDELMQIIEKTVSVVQD